MASEEETYGPHIRTMHYVNCRSCGRELSTQKEKLDLIISMMEAGWTLGDKGVYCDDCSTERKSNDENAFI